MNLKYLGFIFALLSLSSQATDFKLGRFERYGSNSNSIELGLVLHGAKISGSATSFENIISLLALTNDDLKIRILPGLSVEAQVELLEHFQVNMPEELKKVRSSEGNIHDPAILPLSSRLPLAIKTTSYYKELESGVSKVGFEACELSYEKFSFADGNPWLAELNLKCRKKKIV